MMQNRRLNAESPKGVPFVFRTFSSNIWPFFLQTSKFGKNWQLQAKTWFRFSPTLSESIKLIDLKIKVEKLVFFTNFVPKTYRFWRIRLLSIQWPWNPGWGSLKVIKNYPIQSGSHDFLLTFHSNHRPISHRFRDKRRCMSKIEWKSPIFPPPVFNDPDEGGNLVST